MAGIYHNCTANGDTRLWRLDTVLPDPGELPTSCDHLTLREKSERGTAFPHSTQSIKQRNKPNEAPEKFRLISKYNLHDAIHKANS